MSSRKLETRVVNFVDLVGEAAFSPRVLLAIPLVIATLLLGAWLIFGGRSTGQLTVTVAGPNNQAIGNVQVFVDGQQVCDRSPCRLAELAAGTHLIRAAAEGYTSTADQALVVEAGDALAQNFALAPAKTASVPQNPPPPVQAVPPVPVEPAPVKLDEQPSAAADEAKREVTESAAPTPAKQGGSSAAPRAVAASTPATAKPKKTTGATLNLNSTPASTIVLDGRPLGRTPQNGVSVTAGKHTVVFVNPQRGRKTVKVQVSAGGNKNVSVRF